ncbi:MAG: hypothetical protein AAB466_12995 [Verrucomicrobiota bacterium]
MNATTGCRNGLSRTLSDLGRMSLGLVLGLLVFGCASTQKIDWNSRVGNYTYDQVVLEFGPADKLAELTDGTKVGEWLLQRGSARGSFYAVTGHWVQHYSHPPSPDYFLRLTFDPKGKLREWRKVVK